MNSLTISISVPFNENVGFRRRRPLKKTFKKMLCPQFQFPITSLFSKNFQLSLYNMCFKKIEVRGTHQLCNSRLDLDIILIVKKQL